MYLLRGDTEVEEYFLQCEGLVPLHQEAGRVLGEQTAVSHDPHHVGVPRLLDVVGGDDDAHTWTKNLHEYFCWNIHDDVAKKKLPEVPDYWDFGNNYRIY